MVKVLIQWVVVDLVVVQMVVMIINLEPQQLQTVVAVAVDQEIMEVLVAVQQMVDLV